MRVNKRMPVADGFHFEHHQDGRERPIDRWGIVKPHLHAPDQAAFVQMSGHLLR